MPWRNMGSCLASRAVLHVGEEISCPCRKSKSDYSAVHMLRSYNTLGLQDPSPCGSVSGSFTKHMLCSLARYKWDKIIIVTRTRIADWIQKLQSWSRVSLQFCILVMRNRALPVVPCFHRLEQRSTADGTAYRWKTAVGEGLLLYMPDGWSLNAVGRSIAPNSILVKLLVVNDLRLRIYLFEWRTVFMIWHACCLSYETSFEGWGPRLSVVRLRRPGIRASVGLSKCVRLHEAPKRLIIVKILCETFYVIWCWWWWW